MGPVYGTHPPHHRGGGGQCHTPTTPQGGEGEDLIWDQYMGPIPYGGGGGGVAGPGAGPGAYIYIYLFYLFDENLECEGYGNRTHHKIFLW